MNRQRFFGLVLVLTLLVTFGGATGYIAISADVAAGSEDSRSTAASVMAQQFVGSVIRVNTVEGFRNAVGGLQPGDTLIVEEGVYTMSYLDIRNISGTEADPITIRAEGNVVIRGTSYGANVVEIREVHYLNFIGFEILSETDPYADIDGIKISGSNFSYITFEDLYIHDVSGIGISVFADEAHHLTLRNSEIAYCSGSGLYWGYPNSDIVHDVLIENNYIHHCPRDPNQTTHYGIQFKGWSYRAQILNNVLHDVGGTSRCGIVVYYGRNPLQGDVPEDVNVVRGNVLWNCRNEGITAMSDAIIENNIVFDAEYGINLQTYSDESFSGPNFVENLTVRSNTVFRCRSRCINISGWGSVGDNVSFTGNAAYQDVLGKTAIGGSTGSAVARGNVYYGTCSLGSGVIEGNGLSDFAQATASGAVPDLDFYPAAGSVLIDVVSNSDDWPAVDFNDTTRPHNGSADAGAYERVGDTNPGWRITEGFKEGAATQGGPQKTASTITPQHSETITYTVLVQGLTAPPTATVYLTDVVPSGLIYVSSTFTTTAGTINATMAPTLTWTGLLTPTPAVTVTYAVTVTAATPQIISNTASIVASGYQTTAHATIIANGYAVYLPLVLRNE